MVGSRSQAVDLLEFLGKCRDRACLVGRIEHDQLDILLFKI
jgi:hypothetical protein